MAVEALRTVDTVLALGLKAGEVVARYCKAIGAPVPLGLPQPDDNEGLYYTVAGDTRPLRLDRLQQEHKRHTRKYAEGAPWIGPQLLLPRPGQRPQSPSAQSDDFPRDGGRN